MEFYRNLNNLHNFDSALPFLIASQGKRILS